MENPNGLHVGDLPDLMARQRLVTHAISQISCCRSVCHFSFGVNPWRSGSDLLGGERRYGAGDVPGIIGLLLFLIILIILLRILGLW